MKKQIIFIVFITLSFFCVNAQDTDFSNLIVNNSFEYAWEGQVAQSGIDGWYSSSWRPWKATDVNHQNFYGWSVTDWSFRTATNNSQSLESSANPREGTFDIAIFGDQKFGDMWELYQVIDKNQLSAGTYKIEAKLAVRADRRTTQRVFANNRVQYYGPAINYTKAQMTVGEVATFAGWAAGNDELKDMVVYVTIGEDEDLKIGIRTSGKKFDGTMAANDATIYGCFKADYFRLTKIDPTSPIISDAKLSSLTVNAVLGNCALVPAFDPNVTSYTCVLPKGTKSIRPKIKTNFDGATYTGDNSVDVSSGTGVSTIEVKAFDGVTTKTYTINYSCATTGTTDLTHLIENNSFEYASDGTLLDADGDQIVDASHTNLGKDANGYRVKNSTAKEFYKWSVTNWDFASSTNTSQGMNRDFSDLTRVDGNYGVWLGGDKLFTVGGSNSSSFEFFQTIDKDKLSAGTYKIQCLMAVEDGKRTSQRLFANQSVQYHGNASQYVSNQTPGEVSTFAGWPTGVSLLQEMKVYTTITEEESLKIGVRTGDIKGDGSIAANANPLWGWFKTDYFRLVKIDPIDAADATLKSLTISSGSLSFNPTTTTYTVEIPNEITSVTPTAAANIDDATVTGVSEVVLDAEGKGTSTITVKALDGSTTKTYTVHYQRHASELKGLLADYSYKVVNKRLSVYNCPSYTVYSVSGIKVAEIRTNADDATVSLPAGCYIVNIPQKGTFKVVVK